MTAEQKSFWIWLFKQTIGIIVLVVINVAQYNYFTVELNKRDAKIEKLESKIDLLQHQIFLKTIIYDTTTLKKIQPKQL